MSGRPSWRARLKHSCPMWVRECVGTIVLPIYCFMINKTYKDVALYPFRRRQRRRQEEERSRAVSRAHKDRIKHAVLEAQRHRTRPLTSAQRDRAPDARARGLCPQDQSSFFAKLPKELRLLVFEYLLGSADIPVHLYVFQGQIGSFAKLGAVRCTMPFDSISACMHLCNPPVRAWMSADVVKAARSGQHSRRPPDSLIRPLGLLCSCRRAYFELVDVLYQHFTLTITQWHCLSQLVRSTLKHSLAQIRSLDLDIAFDRFSIVPTGSWLRSQSNDSNGGSSDGSDDEDMRQLKTEMRQPIRDPYEALQDLPALRRLRICINAGVADIGYPGSPNEKFQAVQIAKRLKPLVLVRAQDFEVYFPPPWSSDIVKRVATKRYSDAPFRVLTSKMQFVPSTDLMLRPSERTVNPLSLEAMEIYFGPTPSQY